MEGRVLRDLDGGFLGGGGEKGGEGGVAIYENLGFPFSKLGQSQGEATQGTGYEGTS